METIDQYIISKMQGKIERRANSPFWGIILFVAGIALVVLAFVIKMGDSVQTALLSVGVMSTLVGAIIAVLCVTKSLWHYHYLPSNSAMMQCRNYLSASDYQLAVDALRQGRLEALSAIHPVTSSNSVLHIVASKDGALALVQAGRLDSGEMEPGTEVITLSGTELPMLADLLKK